MGVGTETSGDKGWRCDSWIDGKLEIRFCAHLEDDAATARDLLVVEPSALLGFAVQGKAVDVDVGGVGTLDVDFELLALAKVDDGVLEER